MLAAASDAVIIGFNVSPVGDARAVAEREGVEIRTYTVIYEVVEELRAAMEGLLEPEEVEATLGTAEVRQTFKRLARRHDRRLLRHRRRDPPRRAVRLVRDGTVIYDGKIGTLRRFQEDVARGRIRLRVRHRARGLPGRKEGDVFEVVRDGQVERDDAPSRAELRLLSSRSTSTSLTTAA